MDVVSSCDACSCYKLPSVIRWLKGGEYFRASRKATWPCNSIFMWVQAPPLRCRGASIPPSLATGAQQAEAGVNGGIGKPQSCKPVSQGPRGSASEDVLSHRESAPAQEA